MYLLDTDHLSLLQRPGCREYPVVFANLNTRGGGRATASVVSFHEQVLGCHDLIANARTPAELVRGYELLHQVIAAFTTVMVLPFDDAAAREFLRLKRSKLRIGSMDLRIAAAALTRGLIVVTRNARDFGRVPGLRLEDWTK